jgi:hypothetical protein
LYFYTFKNLTKGRRSLGDSSLGWRSGDGTEDGTGSFSRSNLEGSNFFMFCESEKNQNKVKYNFMFDWIESAQLLPTKNHPREESPRDLISFDLSTYSGNTGV